jgi:predicted DNA-binding transcriptional regulator YafY
VLHRCRRAVVDRRVLRLRYRDAIGNVTERDVEPWAVTAGRGAWYLQAHCRRAAAPRDFRLDRVDRLEPTGEPAPTPPAEPPAPGYRPAPGDPRIEIAVRRDAAGVLDDLPGARLDRRAGDDGWLRATAPVGSLDWAARFVLAAAGTIVPLAPPHLVKAVRERAEQTRHALAELEPR